MPVETKVTVATVASTLTGFVVVLLANTVFKSGVPAAVTDVVSAAVVGAVTFGAAWLAKHTPRLILPVLAAPPPPPAGPLPVVPIVELPPSDPDVLP
jgi:hypothetical protein